MNAPVEAVTAVGDSGAAAGWAGAVVKVVVMGAVSAAAAH
jgi:hypothetical protein